MSIVCIGVGPGDPELMTVKGARYIQEADVIYVPVKRAGSQQSTALQIAETYVTDVSKIRYLYFPMRLVRKDDEEIQGLFKEHAETMKEASKGGKNVVFLTLGDAMVYATFHYVAPYLEQVEYIPGIASFQQTAAVFKEPLCMGEESFGVVNMTQTEELLEKAFQLHENLIVMKVSRNPEKLRSLILSYDFDCRLVSNLGLEDEVITRDVDILKYSVPYFTTAFLTKRRS